MQPSLPALARTGKRLVNLGKGLKLPKPPAPPPRPLPPPAPVISRFAPAVKSAAPPPLPASVFSRFAAAGEGAAPSARFAALPPLPRGNLPALAGRAPPRPEARFSLAEAERITEPARIRALLEELEAGSSQQFRAGTRGTTMQPTLLRLLRARGRIYEAPPEPAAEPPQPPELATPETIQRPTPISEEVSAIAQEGGISAANSRNHFMQATEDAATLVSEVIPLSGRTLLTPIAEQEGQTAAEAIRALPEVPPEEQLTPAEIEEILDSIFPGRLVGRALELVSQNLDRMEGVFRGRMPRANVNTYNRQIQDLISVTLIHTPAPQVRKLLEVFTPARLTRLKSALGAYFLRNPLDARLILDELITILSRGQYNAEIIEALTTDLNIQPAGALARLQALSRDIQATALQLGMEGRLAYAKGMGWFGARAFYTLVAAGLGAVGLFIAAYANINSVEDLAIQIRLGRDIFDNRFPGIAEFRDRAALLFQGVAATLMDTLYDTTGVQRPAQRPSPAGPPEVVRPPREVWAWAHYIGEYSRMLRDLLSILIAQRQR